MKLKRLEIHNYKSLRNVVIEPAPLSVFVGPNAAGKSNLADALDFLGEVYRWELEGAVKKKGGYENICFRTAARPDEAIRFRVAIEIPYTEWSSDQWVGGLAELSRERMPEGDIVFEHGFILRRRSKRAALFGIDSEEIQVSFSGGESARRSLLRIVRNQRGLEIEEFEQEDSLGHLFDLRNYKELLSNFPDSRLLLDLLKIIPFSSMAVPKSIAALRVFQLSPQACRESGVPTPNADLDRFGRNLPAVIDYLKRNEPQKFDEILNAVRWIMPTLESIEANFTQGKRLGLFLKEAGVKQPWAAEDISDGTIQAIALLAATFDPRIPILVIEEPENSVHPWAIRSFIQAFREASEKKQIFLTTHSPIVIDQILPEELWVVQRPELETKITPVLELDPYLKDAWDRGKLTLSEYLDSGAVPAAVPAPGV